MNNIATYILQHSVLASALQLQAAYDQAVEQESSGLVSQSYGGLGDNAQQLLDLQSEASQAQTYATEAQLAGNRAQASYSAIGSIITEMNSLATTLSSAVSGSSVSGESTASLDQTGQDALSTIAGQLNSQYGSDYLFGGSMTQTAPVDLSDYAPASPATTADTSYYQGNDAVASVRVSSQQTVSYGVTADNSAFEEALRAAYIVSQASADDSTTLQQAYTLAKQAVSDLSSLQQMVSQSASELSAAQTDQTSYVTFLTNTIGNLKDVDTAAVAAQVSAYQTQLQSSYSALASVLKVNLSAYL